MKIQSCPKFNTCNAPICILDKDWELRPHLKEDACCFYLLESQKDGAEAIFRGAGLDELYEIATSLSEDISSRQAPIRRCMARAKTTPSRMIRFRKEHKHG